jgi:amino acid adenylation domain-containing protein
MSILRLFDRLEELGVNLKLVDGQLKINAPKGKLTPILIDELKDKKGTIIEFLQKHVQKREKYASIKPVEKREYYPLSSAQKRLYFLQQMAPQSTAYNMPLAIQVGKEIDKDAFESALKKLIVRHESLRTSFLKVNDVPVQWIHPPEDIEFVVQYYDLAAERGWNLQLIKEKGHEDVGPLRRSLHPSSFRFDIHQFVRSFDLSRAPLIRSAIVKVSDGVHFWLLDIHHIISDGTSHMILANDFLSFYKNKGKGLEPLKLQYKDFSQWQNGLFESGVVKAQEDYWLQVYADAPEIPRLNLPADFKRPEVFGFTGDNYRFILEGQEAVQFRILGAARGGTLYMSVLAALNALFYKYTAQTDIIIGTGIAGRLHAELQGIMGMFVNTLALRSHPQGEKTYESLLKEVIANSIRAFENQDLQFEELVDKLELERDASRNPLFDILMVVQNFKPPSSGLAGIEDFGQMEALLTTSKFDITFFVYEEKEKEEIFVEIEYYSAIFKKETIIRLAKHFKKLVKEVISHPLIQLDDIDIISEEEKQQLLVQFNDTFTAYPREKTIGVLFEEQVEKVPLSTAIVLKDEHLTYKTLNEESNQLANYLHKKNEVVPGQPIGLLMDRSISIMVAIFGILKAGGAYIPISPAFPGERIKNMVDDAGIQILIGEKRYVKTLNRLQWECQDLETFLCIDSKDILSEDETEESELMNRKLWEYVGETSVDEITGGGWNSSYTGTPIPKEEMDEYGDNILKKLEPLLHKDMRVLEIGTASGISMYRIAPRIGFYYGTDLSNAIIEKNRKRIKEEGHHNIKLHRLAAHEILQIDEKDFDLVIINSVIQCFNGHNYLRKVLRKAIDLIKKNGNGYIFIGDIMDQDLKEDLVNDLVKFKEANRDKNYKTKTDWSEELFISRSFLEDLPFDYPEIHDIEFSGKIYTIENELTRFRYDALMIINKNKKSKASLKPKERHKKQQDLRILKTHSTGKVRVNFGSDSLAYIIYTSGSTGKPKGTLTTHYNVTRVVKDTNYIEFQRSDRVLQLSDYAFDGSVFDIYGALLNGAALVMLKREDVLEIETLCRLIKKEKISVFFVTTALFNTLVDVGLESLSGVRKILFGGERVSEVHAAKALRFLGKDRILHVYGPTETTVYATYFPIKKIQDRQITIPIGAPIANTTIYILDSWLRLVPIGISGEIYIGGPGVCRGYLNQPELTAEKFDQDFQDDQDDQDEKGPASRELSQTRKKVTDQLRLDRLRLIRDRNMSYTSYLPYLKLYRTGDLCRWLPDGNIEFLGRIDHQVKIRGFRIELGEIESRLLKHSLIKEAVVLDRDEGNGERYLCAYIVPERAVDTTELRQFLGLSLPEYMIPSYFVQIDKMPLGSTGKVDKKALPSPEHTVGENYEAPRDELEKKLVHIWSEILGVVVTSIGIDDNFFERGGHSLRATVLTSKIQKELDVKVPLAEVFKGPTIRELVRYIHAHAASKERYVPIEPVEKREYYPLSSAQSRFYILQEVTPESTAYNMTAAYQLEGFVDKEKFEKSMRILINRHEVLRTSFQSINGRPVQRVHDEVEFEFEYYDLATKDIEVTKEGRHHHSSFIIHHLVRQFIRPFDLSQAPLLRLGLIRLEETVHILMFDMHHIITDGTSMSIFLTEFMTLYSGGKLSPLTLQYKDFARWQHDQVTTGKLKREEEYWLKRFFHESRELPVLNMPTDFPRPAVQSFEGDKFDFKLETSLTSALKNLMKETGATLYMVLLAVYNILLARYTDQEDIILGTTIAGRHHSDLQKIIGLLIETLVQRNFPRGNLEFKTFLEMVKKETLESHENQAYPFREIIRIVGAENEVSRNPVFDAMLIVQNFEAAEFHLEGLTFSPYQPAEEELHQTSKVDFTIEAFDFEERGEIHFTLEYCTRLYKRETRERFTRHFINIIRAVVSNPAVPLADIEVMDESEKKQLLETFNDTSYKTGEEMLKMVVERFDDQADKTPDRIAITGIAYIECRTAGTIQVGTRFIASGLLSLTYKELNDKSNQLAHLSKEKGVQPNTIVGLMVESSVEMAVGIWGILKAGGAYMPIDPDCPEERIKFILADSNAKALVSGSCHCRELACLFPELIDLNKRRAGGLAPLYLYLIDHPATRTPKLAASPEDLAYIIYTSGSTGRPKGVLVEHQNLANYVNAVENEIELRSDDTVLQQCSLTFDAFVEEFYLILLRGGKLAIPGKMLVRDIPGLCQFIARHQVSLISSAPQMVNELNKALREGLPAPLDPRKLLASIRIVLVGGDVVKSDYIDKFLETAEVYNTYGPTESTVCATYYRCSESADLPADVPIGKPLSRYRIYILNTYGNLSPIGVGGECCVAGPGVTRGYMNQPEMTEEKFINYKFQIPKYKQIPNYNLQIKDESEKGDDLAHHSSFFTHHSSLLYKTGDLARWLSDGNIEFLGRIDRQVKIRGYRIELAEIESQLTALENMREAVVVDEKRKSGDKYLAAYVVCDGTFDQAEIKSQLSQQLPDYMIPTYIVKVEAIPWTPIGKVDRKRLPKPDKETDLLQPDAAPRSEIEKRLAHIWQEILEKDRVGIDDNFFDLGGTSLDIIKVNTRIKEEFNQQIPVVSLFKYTTIRSLVHCIDQGQAENKTGISKEKQEEMAILEAIKMGQNKLKGRTRKEAHRTGLEIAVIGMSGIFPGAGNLHEFWENLKNGVETIHFFTDEELLEVGVDAETLKNPHYIKAKGIIEGVEYFDASFFGYTPMEAQIMDPQMRVFQQCIWHALEDAGYDPYSYHQRIGLYAGASSNFYWEGLTLFSNINQGLSGFLVAQLADKDFMCTHISYKLNLKGPSCSIQTACSTSLVAIHYAVKGLLHGECEMALAGGVSIAYPPKQGYIFQEGMIFSSDGHNRTFDAQANGSVFGDGVGVVVLKPLEDAVADRDHIYAVIKGSAINNDGFRKVGYTAPSIQGQMEVIRGALWMAEVEPESITYIEAHGTATPLGDTVEIEALKQAFKPPTGSPFCKRNYCGIGTVKSNMGHLYVASGAAGFIKTVLALKHRLLPPSLHFKTPNLQINFENTPFYVNTTLKEWRNDKYPLRAGVSSFGIGGTNAHVVLEEWDGNQGDHEVHEAHEGRKFKLLLLSAKTPSALNKMTENLLNDLTDHRGHPINPVNPGHPGHPGLHFADAAYTLQVGRKYFPYRRMMVAAAPRPEQEAGQFALLAQRTPIVHAKENNPPIIFMFCGQGSQYVNMGIDLYHTEPVFQHEMDHCFSILKSLTGTDFKEILYPGDLVSEASRGGLEGNRPVRSLQEQPAARDSQQAVSSEKINQPEFTLPVVFSFEYALAKLLITWGILPTAMIGYSFGEYTAACLAKVFSLEDALNMIVTRGQLIQQTPGGKMTSVTLPEHELRPLLNEGLSIAIVNGPTCIVSGRKEDVEAFEQEMKQKRMICVPLNMSHAVHSVVMNPIRNAFEQRIREFQLNKPHIPFISNVTAQWITAEEVTTPGYWGAHLCSTVRFSDGLRELLKQENAIFIEIGPGRILGMMVRVHPDKTPGHMVLNTVKHPQESASDDYFLLDKVGQLWQHGQTIDWAGFYGEEKRYRVPLPTYPFEGKRYWIDEKALRIGNGLPVFSQALGAVQTTQDTPSPTGVSESLTGINGLQTSDEAAPRSPLEIVIARMWKEFMGLDTVGIHDDFFQLNGSSLVATQIIARLMQEYKVEIPMNRFYENPTIAHLADLVNELQAL